MMVGVGCEQCGCEEGASLSLPPPLWGRVGEGVSHELRPRLGLPPSLPLPRKGGGNERSLPTSRAKFFNDFSVASTVHGVVFDLVKDGSRP